MLILISVNVIYFDISTLLRAILCMRKNFICYISPPIWIYTTAEPNWDGASVSAQRPVGLAHICTCFPALPTGRVLGSSILRACSMSLIRTNSVFLLLLYIQFQRVFSIYTSI